MAASSSCRSSYRRPALGEHKLNTPERFAIEPALLSIGRGKQRNSANRVYSHQIRLQPPLIC
ncbi:MAG: hypothetical protein WBA89_13695 [Microcoleus sp.]|uniref:hypothetical protein n=1 Tax=Microcoleus sp. TaxID=44472 RepID=UPI003C78708F